MADKDMSGDNRDSIRNTLIVAVSVSLVCSVLVSASAVLLRPLQLENQDLYRKRIVLEVAGLYEPGADIADRFAQIEPRLVELASGDYSEVADPQTFDALDASGDAELGIDIPPGEDIAGIRRRAKYAPVYLVRSGERIEQVILPVYGSGLWSTMYGYLSLERDGTTVRGLQFYEHAETAGLGDQVDKPDWRAQWSGKQLYDDSGSPALQVVRGQATAGPGSIYEVDGLSGATLTGRGVTNLLHYWTGPNAFGPYLQRLASEAGDDE